MDYEVIYGNDVTLSDLYFWHSQGYSFIIEDGKITHITKSTRLGDIDIVGESNDRIIHFER